MTTTRHVLAAAIAAAILAAEAAGTLRGATATDWPQWGGPEPQLHVRVEGPRVQVAARRTDDGSGRAPSAKGTRRSLADGGRLYTMYRPLGPSPDGRRSQEEVIAALDASTGTTIWEYTYPSPTTGIDFSEGAGPHATPLVTGRPRLRRQQPQGDLRAGQGDGQVVGRTI